MSKEHTSVPAERKIPAPSVNPEVKPFFDGAAAGKLMLKYCTACSKFHHYPRALCPLCYSDKTEWREAKGTGTVYTYSVLRRGVPVPYCIAYVTLEEGVSMMTNLVDCDLDKVRIGDKVKVVFKPSDGGPAVPMFTKQGQTTFPYARVAATDPTHRHR